jgi:hypothetical protein
MAFERLQQAVSDFELATTEIKACEERLGLLNSEKGEVEIKLQQVGNLQLDEASQLAEANAAGERYNALESNDQRISKCRSGIQTRENAMAPKRAAVRQLEEVAESKKQLAGHAVHKFEDAGEGLRKLRFRHELARAYVRLFELTAENDRLATKAARVRQSKDDFAEVERNLAAIPAIDNAKLKKLQSLDRKRSDAEVALKAMAAGLEVLEAAEPVMAGDISFAVGQTQILTEDTEIRIGSGTRLRVKPGGGTTLAETRTAVLDAQREVQKALDKLGAASLSEASDFCARRQQLDQRTGEIKACGWQKRRREGSKCNRLMRNVTYAKEARTLHIRNERQTAVCLTCRKGRSQPGHSDRRLRERRRRFLSSCLAQVTMMEATDQGQLDDFAAVG